MRSTAIVEATMAPPALTSGDLLPCQTTDPDVFFPEKQDPNGPAQRKLAAALCAACPVRVACLEYAIEHLPYGYAGGMPDYARRRIVVARAAAARSGAA